MNNATPENHHGNEDRPPPPERDPNCDPQLIDDVTCRTVGVAAQATYNATYHDQLEKAKTDYDKTRKDYRTKRHDAALQVQDLKHQIKHLIERVRCMIEQKRVTRCLDDAFDKIVDELRCCPADEGCCVDECEYVVDDVDELEYAALLKRIVTYQRTVDDAKDCFTKLVGEPDALVKRVEAVKALVDTINTSLAADQATTDLKRVYATALVANRDIHRIWAGFEQTHDFVDCLCRALSCWTKGCEAISILTGAKAVAECKQAAQKAHCDALKTNTVDEILACYDKICPNDRPCSDSSSDDDDGSDDDGDEICPVCGHRHPPHKHES